MSDFADFLLANAGKMAGKLKMFEPGHYSEQSKQPWTPLAGNQPVSLEVIRAAEKKLGCKLPRDYCDFMQTIGPGLWAGMAVLAPDNCFTFDFDCAEMADFVVLACNVNGCGDYLAFNPRVADQVYFCGHDPFGYAVAGLCFDLVIRKTTLAALCQPQTGVREFFAGLSDFHEVEPGSAEKPSGRSAGAKPWWQFW
ncbi:MAG: SMI1/KNR4 family protein [Cyanobacteria bacterium SZAS LIN-2]|nr:SMI1/KNR4 family protein [Cyanobacteria bacterium SZAS LIN-2]